MKRTKLFIGMIFLSLSSVASFLCLSSGTDFVVETCLKAVSFADISVGSF